MSDACMVASFSGKSGLGIYSKRLNEFVRVDEVDWKYNPDDSFFKRLLFSIPKSISAGLKVRGHKIVHVQYHVGEFMPFFLFIFYFFSFGKKIIITLHESHVQKGKLFLFFYNMPFYLADKLIVHNEVHRSLLPEKLQKKASVIPMAVFRKILSEEKAQKDILIPGFINDWKDYETVIKAVGLLGNNTTLDIIGKAYDKKYFNNLRDLIIFLGLQNRIFLRDEFLSDERLDFEYARHKFIIIPYKWSTMSAVLANSVARGKLCLISDIPSFLEFSADCLPSFKVGDAADCANKIRDLLFNEAYFNKWNVDALCDKYNPHKIARFHKELYKEVLK